MHEFIVLHSKEGFRVCWSFSFWNLASLMDKWPHGQEQGHTRSGQWMNGWMDRRMEDRRMDGKNGDCMGGG